MALIKIKVIAGELADKVVWNHESEIMMLSITYKTVDGLVNCPEYQRLDFSKGESLFPENKKRPLDLIELMQNSGLEI